MTLGDIIYQWRHSKEHKMSQEEFGKKIGTSRMYISMLENNYNPSTKKPINPSLTILKACADAMNMDIDILMKKLDDDQLIFLNEEKYNAQFKGESNVIPLAADIIRIPILGKISAGLPLYAEENLLGYDYIPASSINPNEEYFCLVVKGDSMNLKFNEGDRVLIKKQDTLENGEIGVILVNGDDATIKKYRYDNDMVILEPMSTNSENHVQIYNPKEVNIKIVGKAIQFISNL